MKMTTLPPTFGRIDGHVLALGRWRVCPPEALSQTEDKRSRAPSERDPYAQGAPGCVPARPPLAPQGGGARIKTDKIDFAL